MSEETTTDPAPQATEQSAPAAPVESPPPALQPLREQPDPHARLAQLAMELMRSHNRRLVIEYLRLRRAVA